MAIRRRRDEAPAGRPPVVAPPPHPSGARPPAIPLEFVPLQSANLERRFPGVGALRPSEQLLVISVDGAVYRGDVPATIARIGSALYAVNARFSTPPTPDTDYAVVRVDRH